MKNSIIYNGPSLIDGRQIVVIVTGLTGSSNIKTGDMLQTWIIDANVSPIEASRLGLDRSICGDCVHRGSANKIKPTGWADNRSCYVNLVQAPSAVYRAMKRGLYPLVSSTGDIATLGKGKLIRLGSYGDPAAVPQIVWDALLSDSIGHTGYTHQQGNKELTVDHSKLMISADSKRQAQGYHLNGKRTFRVISVSEWDKRNSNALLRTEVLCPASKEAGFKTTCSNCELCNGSGNEGLTYSTTGRKQRKSVAIVAHGVSRNKVL